VQRSRLLAAHTLLMSLAAAPILAEEAKLPACEPSIRATEFAGSLSIIEDCHFEGEAVVSFTVKANGRTTNIVVQNVRAARGDRYRACLSSYARTLIQGYRFPKRDQACHHVMPLTFGTKS
jgi:hypothetical protein